MTASERTPESLTYYPTVTDPVVDALMCDAAHFNEMLRTTPNPSQEMIRDKLSELNSRWPFSEAPMYVTGQLESAIIELEDEKTSVGEEGTVLVSVKEDAEGEAERCSFWVNESEMPHSVFRAVASAWPETVGSETLDAVQYKLQLYMARHVRVYSSQGTESPPLIHWCEGSIGTLAVRSNIMSSEFATLQAQETFPALAKRIDARLEKVRGTANRIMALKSLRLPYENWTAQEDLYAFNQYVDEAIDHYEDLAQMAINCRPNTLLFDGDNPASVINYIPTGTRIFAMDRIAVAVKTQVRGSSIRQVPNRFELRLHGTLFGQDIDKDITNIQIRLQDIDHLISVRDYHFKH